MVNAFQTSGMFLKNAIERILHDPVIKRRENAQLKKACETALEQLNAEIERNANQTPSSNSPGILPNQQDFILADGYFLPFELACQSKSTKIVITALDCLQKLIAHGHLIGDCTDSMNPERLLIDRIVDTICSPFQGPHTDDAVQLQIIKAILALVLSNTCKVHEGSLLNAVKTCFNIYLASRSPINQSTAKGILTQTINTVFANMEKFESETHSITEVDWDDAAVGSVVQSIVNQVVATCDSSSTSFKDKTINYQNSCHRSRHSSTSETMMPNGSVHNSSNSMANGIVTAANANFDFMHDDFSQTEFKSIEEKDAFLILRSLCRLSMKQLPEDPDPKSHELRSKLLSLEMILLIVQNFNIQLTERHSFLYLIRKYLCLAVTHNAVSPIISVFEKALAIFVQMVNKFKAHLKRPIEVFFKEIIISILESPSSSFEHKWVVLNTVSKIFDNAQSVVDIYINYDCHLTSANIFETLVRRLSKIALDTTSRVNAATSTLKEREKRMREMGLECLIKLLRCLSVWYEELQIGKTGDLSTGMNNGYDGQDETANGYASSDSSVNQLMHLKQQKGIIEHGIELFAHKPSKGIEFLQQKGFVGKTPQEIAQFLHTEDRLDKTMVGDFLGDGNELNKQVMYAYVDTFDFTNTWIVKALRILLDKFRLPGEAQKIDRIMEKFASRYCECNPGIFACADTAYVLSYSIIMLTTDLHNPQVRNKMTKEHYFKMNKGINDQGDLPQEFLSDIYDDIAANEIKMKAGSLGKPKIDVASATYRQRKLFQNIELQTIAETAHVLMEAATYSQAEFTSASHFEHIIWSPCLAAFSIGLQDSDEEAIWQRCLQGFRYGIRVACVFRMNNEQRNAFVQALTRFTLLTAKSSLTEMKSKNIESIKLLITIGDEDGNFLDECWYDCLKCISQLELAQLIGSGNNTQSENIKSMFKIDEKSLSNLQECLGETSSQSVVVAVDKIFQGSSKLTGDAIVHFVRSLCRVSMEELSSPATPRMFMLQKIVEISFYNMNRIRIEWSMIWNVLGEHFNLAGCSLNAEISYFALDALRQLSTKFLEKGELPNFRLQKEFLRPFEVIMSRNKSLACREMIIDCITYMVKSHANKIRSGWKNVFSVCTMAASESREKIVQDTFVIISEIMTIIFPNHFVELMDSFQEAIKCLSEFACNTAFPDYSMEAIRLILNAAKMVSQNTDLINSHYSLDEDHHQQQQNTSADLERVWCKGWFPVIFELSCVIQRCKLDVRTRSLTVMFEIIKNYGDEFDGWWMDLFNVIFRIFDFIKHEELGSDKKSIDNIKFKSIAAKNKSWYEMKIKKIIRNDEKSTFSAIEEKWKLEMTEVQKNEWMMTTCNHALYAIVDVFTQYYEKLAPILLDNIYQQLFWCIQQGSEHLTRAAINCFENLIVSNGEKFTDEMWAKTIGRIVDIFECSALELEETESFGGSTYNETAGNGRLVNGVGSSPQHRTTRASSMASDKQPSLPNGSMPSTPDTPHRPRESLSTPQAQLLSTLNRCIIQVEIVDAVSNFLFGRNAFKVEGPSQPQRKMTISSVNSSFDADGNPTGSCDIPYMFKFVSEEHLTSLIECLLKSHLMARIYNNNTTHRASLSKAAFTSKCKLSLPKLEAHSIHCGLNILFQLYLDANDEKRLLCYGNWLRSTVRQSLDYYLSSHSDTMRSSWLMVVQMLLNRTYDLSDAHFCKLGSDYHLSVARLIESDEQPIIRTALYRVVQRFILVNNRFDSQSNGGDHASGAERKV